MPPESNEPQENQSNQVPPAAPATPNVPAHLKALLQRAHAVADKTKLDHEALKGVVTRNFAKQEEKVAELRMAASTEPVKPIAELKCAQASKCSSTWTNADGKEKVEFCQKCTCRVYDLTGMDMQEVNELIYKMEGRKKFRLHKRADGKFLSGDCPVGYRTKVAKVLAITFLVMIAVPTIMVALTAPPPPAPPPKQAEKAPTPFPAKVTTMEPAKLPDQKPTRENKPVKSVFSGGFPSRQ